MAQTLSKTGITNNNTIQAWQVSQSIDALTGQVAYDITISGSLILTGSFNHSGSIKVSNAITASSFTGSFTGSFLGTATSSSYALSSSYANTASNADNANNSVYATLINNNNQPDVALSGSSGNFIAGNLGLLAGSVTLSAGVSSILNPSTLISKEFQTDFWVTVTKASGSTTPSPSTLYVEGIGLGSFQIKEVGASTNDDVNFIVVYR